MGSKEFFDQMGEVSGITIDGCPKGRAHNQIEYGN